jgi:hypothetical protein
MIRLLCHRLHAASRTSAPAWPASGLAERYIATCLRAPAKQVPDLRAVDVRYVDPMMFENMQAPINRHLMPDIERRYYRDHQDVLEQGRVLRRVASLEHLTKRVTVSLPHDTAPRKDARLRRQH